MPYYPFCLQPFDSSTKIYIYVLFAPDQHYRIVIRVGFGTSCSSYAAEEEEKQEEEEMMGEACVLKHLFIARVQLDIG